MKYQIKIFYQTGDSFSRRDEERFLDGDWENPDIIRENLRRIKEHNEWYLGENNSFHNKVSKPKWIKADDKYPEFSVTLKLDNGTEYKQSTFWRGYFERLYGADAVIKKEEGFSFGDVPE